MAKKQKTALVMHVQPSTARVRVDRMLRHPLYEKAYRSSKSLLADVAPDMVLHAGDTVTIEEIRPVSKRKAWAVVNVLATAKLAYSLKGEEPKEAPSTEGSASARLDLAVDLSRLGRAKADPRRTSAKSDTKESQ